MPISKLFEGRDLSSAETNSDTVRFTKTESYDEAVGKLLHGDDESAKRMQENEKIHVKNMHGTGERKRAFTDVIGVAPHVPNYIAGIPQNMINVRRVKMKKKVLDVLYNFGASGSNTAGELARVNALVIGAIMTCEKRGYRINLYITDLAHYDEEYCGAIIRIKDSGQYIDKYKMAYPLIHPSFLRRNCFRFTEVAPTLTKSSWTWGYGKPMNAENTAKVLSEHGYKFDKVFSFKDAQQVQNEEQLSKMIANE